MRLKNVQMIGAYQRAAFILLCNVGYRSGTVNLKSFVSKVLLQIKWKFELNYRSGMVNSNMVNLKFHLIRSFFEIFATLLLFHV